MKVLASRQYICPVCDSGQYRKFMVKEEIDFVRCLKCGAEGIFPVPDDIVYGKDYYDSWGGQEEEAETSFLKEKTAEFVLEYLNPAPGSALLEIGCAKGDLAKTAVNKGFRVTAIDVNAYAIEVAKKRNIKAEFLNCDLADFLKFDKRFDVVVLVDVIEHIDDPVEFLSAIHKILLPKGRLVLVTPNLSGFMRRTMGDQWFHYKKEHVYYYSKQHMRSLLQKTGFKFLNSRPMVKFLNLRYIENQFGIYQSSLWAQWVRRWIQVFKKSGWYRKVFRFYSGEMIIIGQKETSGDQS